MLIYKCDLCKKTINKNENYVSAGIGWSGTKQLCLSCGKPILKFLEQKGLIENKKSLKTR